MWSYYRPETFSCRTMKSMSQNTRIFTWLSCSSLNQTVSQNPWGTDRIDDAKHKRRLFEWVWWRTSSIQLSANSRLLDIRHMCYEYWTPLLPGKQPRQSDLSVTSTLKSVNWWRHNEYSYCLHPSRSYICNAHMLSRSDQWSDCHTW